MLMTTEIFAQDKYDFNGTISRETLENYLSKSIEYMGICCESSSGPAPYLEDNLRLIKNIRPKYIGRAAYSWDCPRDDDEHYRIAAENAKRIHDIDPQIILQACVFETAYSAKAPEVANMNKTSGVENIPIPDWVFEDFGMPAEKRNFNYEAMIYPNGDFRNSWGPGASVPDITQQETRFWFYYKARRYIDAGYESIHFGQADLIGRSDTNRKHWKQVLDMVRAYGKKHARRHYVLCDAHFYASNAKADGKLLWDFAGFPLRPVADTEPLKAKLEIGHADSIYNTMPGGIHPAGWTCDIIPQLYEIDNFFSGIDSKNSICIWGTDESVWFANSPEEYRNDFLKYTAAWLRDNVTSGYLEMPGRRPAVTPIYNPQKNIYICNTQSSSCSDGFNQEETIKEIFSDSKYNPISKQKQKKQIAVKPQQKPVVNWDLSKNYRNQNGIILIPDRDSSNSTQTIIKKSYNDEQLWLIFRAYGAFGTDEEKKSAKEQLVQTEIKSPAIINSKLIFNGNGYAEIPSNVNISSPEISLLMKIKIPKELFDDDFVLLGKFAFMQSGYYIKYHKAEDILYGEIFDKNNKKRKTVDFRGLKDGEEHAIALIADGHTLKSYVDGKLNKKIAAGNIISNNTSLSIGQNINGLEISDFRIFNRAITEKEISELSK